MNHWTERRKARHRQALIDHAQQMLAAGVWTPRQSTEWLIQHGVVPNEFWKGLALRNGLRTF